MSQKSRLKIKFLSLSQAPGAQILLPTMNTSGNSELYKSPVTFNVADSIYQCLLELTAVSTRIAGPSTRFLEYISDVRIAIEPMNF